MELTQVLSYNVYPDGSEGQNWKKKWEPSFFRVKRFTRTPGLRYNDKNIEKHNVLR